jgi:hypothetical protein
MRCGWLVERAGARAGCPLARREGSARMVTCRRVERRVCTIGVRRQGFQSRGRVKKKKDFSREKRSNALQLSLPACAARSHLNDRKVFIYTLVTRSWW